MPLIPISQIRMGEFVQNCRDRRRAEAIDDGLLQSILANGLIQPVEVRPRRELQDGRKIMVYDLTAGERRIRHILHILQRQPKAFREKFSEDGAPLKLFWDGKQAYVKATFFRGSDVETQIRNLEENRHRDDLLPSELARGIQLVRQKGGTYADAAEVVGLGLKKVEELHRWFQNATAELRRADGREQRSRRGTTRKAAHVRRGSEEDRSGRAAQARGEEETQRRRAARDRQGETSEAEEVPTEVHAGPKAFRCRTRRSRSRRVSEAAPRARSSSTTVSSSS